jgi:penicillin amidase
MNNSFLFFLLLLLLLRLTLANIDVEDLFVERFINYPETYEYKGKETKAVIHKEEISVKGEATPVVFQVVETVHGPVISDMFASFFKNSRVALCSIPLSAAPSLEGMMSLMLSSTVPEMIQAVKATTSPSLNVLWASKRGDFGHIVTGLAPMRKSGWGDVPSPGWTGEYDWDGFIPFEGKAQKFYPSFLYLLSLFFFLFFFEFRNAQSN